MALLTETRPTGDGRAGQNSREAWRDARLLWGDSSARTILLAAFVIAGLLAGFGLQLLIPQPADSETLVSLRLLSVVLFSIGIAVAPADWAHRAVALLCVIMHAICRVLNVILRDPHGPPVTYGRIDAVTMIAIGSLLIMWLVVRHREPITILVGWVSYLVGAISLYIRAVPEFRRFAASASGRHDTTVLDEALVMLSLFSLVVVVALLCRWLDAWVRPPRTSSRHAELPTTGRMRAGWWWLAGMIDPMVIAVAMGALRESSVRASAFELWQARTMLALAVSRMIVICGTVAVGILIVFGREWRH